MQTDVLELTRQLLGKVAFRKQVDMPCFVQLPDGRELPVTSVETDYTRDGSGGYIILINVEEATNGIS